MSELRASSISSRKGNSPRLPDGVVVTGVTTSTSFSGNLTGNVTGNIIGNVTGNVNGNIIGTAGTFSGNVSIGGTLSQEDVTSIDSVGVITARNGIKVSAGQSISAVSGIVTYYGDGSQLSGIEHGVVNFVASGTIANGATVIINADGTVSVVSIESASIGSAVTFETGQVSYPSAAYDSANNRVVIAYKDNGNSNYGTAVVGTVSGTSISFGTPVVFESGETNFISATYDPDEEKVVIVYTDGGDSDKGKAVVGTVSGTSISFGSLVEIGTNFRSFGATYDTNSNKVVIAFQDQGNNVGKGVVGTVSGTSISFGTAVQFNSGEVSDVVSTFDSSNNKVVIAYRDQGNSGHGTAIVGTVSGTSISFGSETVFETSAIQYTQNIYDSGNGKTNIFYMDGGDSDKGKAVIGTVSGTSISFTTPEVFYDTAVISALSAVYDSNASKSVIGIRGASAYGYAIPITSDGSSFSVGSSTVITTNAYGPSATSAFDSDQKKVVFAYYNPDESDKGKAQVYNAPSTNLTTENYIGIAAEAISNGATGKINVVTGTNIGQTGLTTAKSHYIQNDGSLSTSAGDPSVVAGTAISDTKILVRKS